MKRALKVLGRDLWEMREEWVKEERPGMAEYSQRGLMQEHWSNTFLYVAPTQQCMAPAITYSQLCFLLMYRCGTHTSGINPL